MSKPITTTEQAIKAIVHYNTLPPQIDYRARERDRANEAKSFLETLDQTSKDKAFKQINEDIDEYYTPSIKGKKRYILFTS